MLTKRVREVRINTFKHAPDRNSRNKYEIDFKKYHTMEAVLLDCMANMSSPVFYHMLCHVYDANAFGKVKADFIRLVERELKRQYKGSGITAPEFRMIYSIEFKYTRQAEIDNDDDAYDTCCTDLPFLHVHIYIIANMNEANRVTFAYSKLIPTLDKIDGLRKARYFKSKYDSMTYTNLNEDTVPDTFQRMSYLAKLEQKNTTEIPYRKKWGNSKVVR